MKVLITSGATREPIDDVRFLTNISTGKTGAYLTDYFYKRGTYVKLLAGEGAMAPEYVKNVVRYGDFLSLDSLLQQELSKKEFCTVIHLSAVSDFSVDRIEIGNTIVKLPLEGKLDSAEVILSAKDTSNELKLVLKKNFKLVEKIKEYSKGSVKKLTAFKLTDTSNREKITTSIGNLFEKGNVDFVVHNDLSDMRATERHRFEILSRTESLGLCNGKGELAEKLYEILGGGF